MNECCDWHAVCLNDQEEVKVGNNIEKSYVSYCPECNSVLESVNDQLFQVEGDRKAYYIAKYQEKVNLAIKNNKE